MPDGIEHDVALVIDEIIPDANIITKTYEYSQIMFSLIMAAKGHMQIYEKENNNSDNNSNI